MVDRNDERPSPRAGGGSGASPFADFSSFREMIREERGAARAEREAAAAEARVERETSAAEHRRLMAEVNGLKLQLAEERRSRPLLLYRAVQRLGLTAGCISSPCGGWEVSLLQALHVHEPQRAVSVN